MSGSETNSQPDFSFLTGRLLPGATDEVGVVANSLVPKGSTDLSLPHSGGKR